MFFFLLLPLVVMLSACDEGDIVEKTTAYKSGGYVVKMTGSIANMDSWPDGYDVVVAVFNEDKDADHYVSAKRIPTTYDGSAFVYHVSDVIGAYTSIRLCVVNNLHMPVMNVDTLYSVETSVVSGDTIYYDASGKDVAMFKAVTDMFEKESCTQCHVNSKAAGKLGLKAADAYAQLVNVTSNHYPNESDAVFFKRVVPGNADTSLLYKVLMVDTILTGYNHVSHIQTKKNEYLVRTLVRDWINNEK